MFPPTEMLVSLSATSFTQCLNFDYQCEVVGPSSSVPPSFHQRQAGPTASVFLSYEMANPDQDELVSCLSSGFHHIDSTLDQDKPSAHCSVHSIVPSDLKETFHSDDKTPGRLAELVSPTALRATMPLPNLSSTARAPGRQVQWFDPVSTFGQNLPG